MQNWLLRTLTIVAVKIVSLTLGIKEYNIMAGLEVDLEDTFGNFLVSWQRRRQNFTPNT